MREQIVIPNLRARVMVVPRKGNELPVVVEDLVRVGEDGGAEIFS